LKLLSSSKLLGGTWYDMLQRLLIKLKKVHKVEEFKCLELELNSALNVWQQEVVILDGLLCIICKLLRLTAVTHNRWQR
jgi:hypothetical protein